MGLRVTYFVNEYPKISHTFVRREILALEEQGLSVQRIALRGWDTTLVDEADKSERERTRYVLRAGTLPLLWALIWTFFTAPLRVLSALGLAIRTSRKAVRPLPYHLVCLAEACRILPWIKEFGATHVHAHFGTNSAEIVMLARALGAPPYSFTVHGQDEVLWGGIELKVSHSAFVVAISSHGRGLLFLHVHHQHWSKVEVVPCGLEPAFHSLPARPPPSVPRLICVARLSFEKAHLLLVEAVRLLTAKGVEVELVLAGDGDLRPDVTQAIQRDGLERQVRIVGWLDNDQVRQEILQSRALVLASLTEGLPIVIMEAMALRRPVVATYVGGIPELVTPDNGWLSPAGSAVEFAAAMERCLTTPAARLEAMGEDAHRRVTTRHDVRAAAEKLAALFAGQRG